jgi:hypothetical protein
LICRTQLQQRRFDRLWHHCLRTFMNSKTENTIQKKD